MRTTYRPVARRVWALLCSCALGGCLEGLEAPQEAGDQPSYDIEAKGLATPNGLRFINGLRAMNGLAQVNGLRFLNGLTFQNGLRAVNGFEFVTGLASTYHHARVVGGKSINCVGKVKDVTCTGAPDGLLSKTTGLMRSEEGVHVARYVVNCALAADDKIRIKKYDDSLVTLRGGIGLAPGWKHGDCDQPCQERITGCLLSLTNGDARNVSIELSAPTIPQVGKGHVLPDEEATFYGNIFAAKAVAYACMGKDMHAPRMTAGYTNVLNNVTMTGHNAEELTFWDLPYYLVGYCHKARARCTYQGDEPTECAGADGKRYRQVITTHRRLDSTNVRLGAASYYAWRCARDPRDARACDWDYYPGWKLNVE